jgi:hypothetical protein
MRLIEAALAWAVIPSRVDGEGPPKRSIATQAKNNQD